ncbi:MAG: hypothetical protein AB8G95_30640 [Anaerolineae bacterium]
MNAGKIEQIAPPQEIYTRPVSGFVANFLGLSNVIQLKDDGLNSSFDQALTSWVSDQGESTYSAKILIPPYSALIKIKDSDVSSGLVAVQVTVKSFSFRGRFALLNCQCGGHELEFSLDPYGAQHLIGRTFHAGEEIELLLNPNHFVLLKI